MRALLFSLIIFSFSYASQYTFLIDNYDKEIELEAKIITKIAKASIDKKVKLYIPKISSMEKIVYSKFVTLVEDCQKANFIFINKAVKKEQVCTGAKSLFFTNNYKKLLSDKKFYGAFFWSKSRPNIVFVQDRLTKSDIHLPKEYNPYIEDFNAQ